MDGGYSRRFTFLFYWTIWAPYFYSENSSWYTTGRNIHSQTWSSDSWESRSCDTDHQVHAVCATDWAHIYREDQGGYQEIYNHFIDGMCTCTTRCYYGWISSRLSEYDIHEIFRNGTCVGSFGDVSCLYSRNWEHTFSPEKNKKSPCCWKGKLRLLPVYIPSLSYYFPEWHWTQDIFWLFPVELFPSFWRIVYFRKVEWKHG